jgi:hypothetical protein
VGSIWDRPAAHTYILAADRTVPLPVVSGDIAQLEASGALRIIDRKKNLIKLAQVGGRAPRHSAPFGRRERKLVKHRN